MEPSPSSELTTLLLSISGMLWILIIWIARKVYKRSKLKKSKSAYAEFKGLSDTPIIDRHW